MIGIPLGSAAAGSLLTLTISPNLFSDHAGRDQATVDGDINGDNNAVGNKSNVSILHTTSNIDNSVQNIYSSTHYIDQSVTVLEETLTVIEGSTTLLEGDAVDIQVTLQRSITDIRQQLDVVRSDAGDLKGLMIDLAYTEKDQPPLPILCPLRDTPSAPRPGVAPHGSSYWLEQPEAQWW